jgi:phosphoenolpyruvate phosphomutase
LPWRRAAPLSAKLIAEASGFDAIWVSGFELSAFHAVPDAGLISPSKHLETAHAISEVADLPVIADLDTGFGIVVNLAFVIPRYEAAGVAAIVIGDKILPENSCSLADGHQSLVSIEEF